MDRTEDGGKRAKRSFERPDQLLLNRHENDRLVISTQRYVACPRPMIARKQKPGVVESSEGRQDVALTHVLVVCVHCLVLSCAVLGAALSFVLCCPVLSCLLPCAALSLPEPPSPEIFRLSRNCDRKSRDYRGLEFRNRIVCNCETLAVNCFF